MIAKIQNYFLSQIKKTPFNDLVKDPDNQEILKGAGTTFSLKFIGLAFSYIFNILFARLYGAEVMGLFALAITVAGIFSIIGLPFLNYMDKIGKYKPVTMIDYQGE
jgi:hypothetical protein